MKISVILINYNGEKFLKDCLDSVFSQTLKPEEIMVADNASADRSREIIRKYPVRTFFHEQNMGFCRAVNQCIRLSSGDYILVLNSDVKLSPEFTAMTSAVLDRDPRIGIVGGKLLRTDTETASMIIDSTGQFISKILKPKERGYGEIDSGQFNVPGYVFSVCGAAAVYRRTMLEDIKIEEEYLDESFFMYFDDFDLGWRAQTAGWKVWYEPAALACHTRGASSKKTESTGLLRRYRLPSLPDNIRIHLIMNRYLVLVKNCTWRIFLRQFFHVVCYEIALRFYLLFFATRLIPRLFHLPGLVITALRNRKIIQSRRRSTDEYMRKWVC